MTSSIPLLLPSAAALLLPVAASAAAWLEWMGCLHAYSVATGERLFELDLETRVR